uniref:Putative sodium-bile acid cotransporter n=1 Tax=Corethrella appendiculata TaxID=1370023 RepID=U5ESB4_9DIPT
MACPMLRLITFICIILAQLLTTCMAAVTWKTTFSPTNLDMKMHSYEHVNFTIENLIPEEQGLLDISVHCDNELVAEIDDDSRKLIQIENNGMYNGAFNVSAIFLGSTEIYIEVKSSKTNSTEKSSEKLPVIVTREVRIIDHIFTGSVATLVSILYINFGAALDLPTVKQILVRPIGPILAFIAQFGFMPLCAYGLGHLLFPTYPELALGLFFTGVSPAGGASNIWSVILNGNVNLSIAMTTISTFAAFAMMPAWIFSLGKNVFDRANLVVPYRQIGTFAIGLVIPLGIGILIQKYCPRVKTFLVRILKPVSTLLILFIVIFAIVTNLYLFELFSWEIIVAGLGLPWLGYMFGFVIAILLRQPLYDALTIGIETGIQNTGIAIFLLRFSLPQPAADLTTVVPVSVAIMTPIPLLMIYIYQKLHQRLCVPESERKMIKDSSTYNGFSSTNEEPAA